MKILHVTPGFAMFSARWLGFNVAIDSGGFYKCLVWLRGSYRVIII